MSHKLGGGLNNNLNDVLFSAENESRPIFMVLDDKSRKDVARISGFSEHDIETTICQTVGENLAKSGNPYSLYETQLKIWLGRGMSAKPPFTELLLCLSHAAEKMSSDGEFSSANYYIHLSRLTGVDRDRLSSYGHKTQQFWRHLSQWLTQTDFIFGRPTAQPINDFKYVSTAISQAVIRAEDKRSFHKMFEKYGFSGGYNISENEIGVYIDDWVRSAESNSHLRKTWGRKELKLRICEIVIAELENWISGAGMIDGDISSSARARNLSLALSFADAFPNRVAGLTIGKSDAHPDVTALNDRQSNQYSMANDIYGSFATISPTPLSLVEEILRNGFEVSTLDSQTVFKWKQKNVIPFVRSENGPFWIETNKASVGETHILMVPDTPTAKARVESMLHELAAQGFSMATADELVGLPSGWCIYENVHFRNAATDYRAPISVSLARGLDAKGGMKLSRNVWHQLAPPSIQYLGVDSPTRIKAFQGFDADGSLLAEANSKTNHCVLELSDSLHEQEELFIEATESGVPMGHTRLLCRSASLPRAMGEKERLGLQYVNLVGAIPRFELHEEDRSNNWDLSNQSLPVVRWQQYKESIASGSLERSIEVARKSTKPTIRDIAGLEIKEILEMSCVERGCHYWICESTLEKGRKRKKNIRMECRDCGHSVLVELGELLKRPKRRRQKPVPKTKNIRSDSEQIDYDLLLDALSYLGSGSWSTFERVLSGFIAEPWQTFEAAKSLEALGYIDVSRHLGSGRIDRWAVCEPTIYLHQNGNAFLRGFRNFRIQMEVKKFFLDAGAKDNSQATNNAPFNVAFSGVDAALAANLAGLINDPHGRNANVIFDPARAISRRILYLNSFTKLMTPISISNDVELERFDVDQGRWRKCSGAAEPGAYRFQWRGQTYIYKDKNGKTAQGSHEMVKWLASREAQRNIHAYNSESAEFTAQLGAEPFGLLGRALCACSGELPEINNGISTYQNVPEDVATTILGELYPKGDES